MPLLNDIHSLVVDATAPNFTAHTYTEIYCGAAATPVINGVTVTMGAGSSIKIKVKTITAATGCVLLGETIDNRQDSSIIGGSYTA
jgi:hypothetical protein